MKTTWYYWLTSLILAIVATLVNDICFPVHEIIPLEFAPDPIMMTKYMLSIDPQSMAHACHILALNTLMDYVFIAGYTLLTFFSFKILLNLFDAPVATWVYLVSAMAGILDVMENNLLLTAAIRQREEFTGLYYYIVRIKWGMAIVPFLLILVTAFYGGVVVFSTRKNSKTTAINNNNAV